MLVTSIATEKRSYSTSGPFGVWMGVGSRLRTGKSFRYVTSHPDQLSPPLCGTKNGYQQKCCDAVQLWGIGTVALSIIHLWINVWVTGKTV